MKPDRAVALSLSNILADGLDDVLAEPFEISLLRKSTDIQTKLKSDVTKKIKTYLNSGTSNKSMKAAFEELSLMPLSHVLVPKKEAFDYRKIAIVSPEDLILFQAVAVMIAEPFEEERRGIARQRIFSYRYEPNVKKGQLFSPKYNLRSFRERSTRISKQKHVNYIVRSDIANFYDRVNIHRLESTLLSLPKMDKNLAYLGNQILLHWAKRNSYGIPIGSNASRIMAEVALFNVDKALVEAKIRFLRFVDDYRIFARSAAGAHSALAVLIELLDREGLFINTRKSSIERLEKATIDETGTPERKVETEKIDVKEFRIFAGYGGTIPIKFRVPTKKSQKRYMQVDLHELTKEIREDDFARPEQLRDLLYGIVIQGRYNDILSACDLVEMFPQFYPLFVDMLIKNAEHLPDNIKEKITSQLSKRLLSEEFLPEYLRASLVRFVGSEEFFHRDSAMSFVRQLERNAGTYLGRTAFEAVQNLTDRTDALEIREYFDRSNSWERRRIIRLMKRTLPEQEYNAWRRAIQPYINRDYFALGI